MISEHEFFIRLPDIKPGVITIQFKKTVEKQVMPSFENMFDLSEAKREELPKNIIQLSFYADSETIDLLDKAMTELEIRTRQIKYN